MQARYTSLVAPRRIIAGPLRKTIANSQPGSIAKIERMIRDIHRDIDKLYEELLPLDTGIDIDMVCYTEEYGRLLECVPKTI
jgi:hypothetical protein